MDCLHYKEIIAAHVDGTLAAEEELQVKSHLDQCPKCKQFFRWETDVKKLLRQKFSPIVVQPSFKKALLERLEAKRKRTSVRWSYKRRLAAVANTEKLLEEIRQSFLLSR